jgi:hypothetical protein
VLRQGDTATTVGTFVDLTGMSHLIRKPSHNSPASTETVIPETTTPSTTVGEPKESANKDLKRDVTNQPTLSVFLEKGKKVSNRKKRNYLAKGGMFFNNRDRLILQLVAAHGWLSLANIAALTDSTPSIRKSIKRLVDHRLLDNRFHGHKGEILYIATTIGLNKTGSKGFSGSVLPHNTTLEHTDAITALHVHLHAVTKTNNTNNLIFLTERELQATVNANCLPARVLALAPWTEQYTDFTDWIPQDVGRKGKLAFKRPDGLLLSSRGGKAQLPIPVEIERTAKSNPHYYRDMALLYANIAKKGVIAPQVLYVCPKWDGTYATVKAALNAVYESSTAPWPAHLPKLKWELLDLDEFYVPISVRRGWLTPRQTAKTKK